jgi:hypothetical protein
MQTVLNAPHIFTPDKIPIISHHESQQLREITSPMLQKLDKLKSRLAMRLNSMDVDSLLHLHSTSQNSQTYSFWHTIVIILISLVMLLGILYVFIRVYFDKLKCHTVKTQDSERNDSLQTPTQQAQAEPKERQNEQNILFSSYSLQHEK